MKKPDETDPMLDEFRTLYIDKAPMLITYACRFIDPAFSEDLVQDVFLKIWKKQAFVYLKDEVKTVYLYRSVRHSCLDYLKHQQIAGDYISEIITQLKIEELYLSENTQTTLLEDKRMSRIYQEIERLPPKCREIFTMVYLEERKTAEISNLLHISPRTVEAQLYKALKMIRNALLIGLFSFFLL